MSKAEPQRWLDAHGNALYSFAMLHLHDSHMAEDVVQECLLAAIQAWPQFRGGCTVRTWLTGILKHKILDEFRRQRREPPLMPEQQTLQAGGDDADFLADGHWREPSADWGRPEACLNGERFWAIIERCIAALPPRAARIVVLRELWEMDTETVCKELQLSPSNLWTSLHRARLRMRQCLQRNDIAGVDHHAEL